MARIERGSPVPFYRQLADILRRDITSGRLGRPRRLATEFELMDVYEVSRTTVRQTIALLQKEGRVTPLIAPSVDYGVTDYARGIAGVVAGSPRVRARARDR